MVRPRPADWSGYGTCVHPEDYEVDWAEFYRNGQHETRRLRADFAHSANVIFGEDPAQLLNIYHPAEPVAGHPLIVFLHGGGFTEGHPEFYDYLGRHYLERGIGFISAGYRLSPDLEYPDSARDLMLAIGWIYRNLADRYAVDRLHVAGHSAGAMLAAQLAFRDRWQADHHVPIDVIDSVTLISGIYDFRGYWKGENRAPEQELEASPVADLRRLPRHTVISYGSEEVNRKGPASGFMARNGQALDAAVTAAGGSVESVPLDGTDHAGTCTAFGDAGSPLFAAVTNTVMQIVRS